MKKLLPIIATSTLLTIGMTSSALAANSISLNQAIDIAHKKVGGDLVSFDIGFSDKAYKNKYKYEIEFVNNNKIYEVEVDANTGRINNVDEDDLDGDDRSEYNAFKQSQINFSQAIKTASSQVNGEVIEAVFDIEKGKSIYEIDVLKNGQKYEVKIDANTGAVISSK